jgi:NADPH:quinone reductase-like Zn-dependent oxidoreductase
VLAVGSSVIEFKPGEKVCMHLVPFLSDGAMPHFPEISGGLGQKVNGTLCQYGVFPRSALVSMPKNCTFEQAATLTCSALTAWNALFGLKGRELKSGDWIVTQGTGGVSIAALQVSLPLETGSYGFRDERSRADIDMILVCDRIGG